MHQYNDPPENIEVINIDHKSISKGHILILNFFDCTKLKLKLSTLPLMAQS